LIPPLLVCGGTIDFAVASPAGASTVTVTNCDDSGAGSLRQTVADANAGDTIAFALSPPCSLITLTSGAIAIAKNLTIDGPGAGTLAVNGDDNASSVFFVDSGVTATITGLTIEGGIDGGIQESIGNDGTLTVTDSTISGNGGGGIQGGIGGAGPLTVTDSTISGNTGSGIASTGPLTVTDSTISHNEGTTPGVGGIGGVGSVAVSGSTVSENTGVGIDAGGALTVTDSTTSGNNGGGIVNAETGTVTGSTISGNSNGVGIDNPSGTLSITGSTISGNSNGGLGGGIYNDATTGSVTVTDSTISGNSAAYGGGIFNGNSVLHVTDSTVAGNSASGSGGGIYNVSAGNFTVTHTTLWGNSAPAGKGGGVSDDGEINIDTWVATVVADSGSGLDCFIPGGVQKGSDNLDDDGSCGFSGSSLSDTPAGLDPTGLANNGGPNQTIALEPGSAAINHVTAASDCTGNDQTGKPWSTPCNIGAIGGSSVSPTTSVLVPSNGATLSGSNTLDASASNATSVEFRLFGGSYGYNAPVLCTATQTIYGWLCSWNTATVPNGTYSLLSEAIGGSGTAFSSGVSITVKNPPTTSILIPSKGATLSGTAATLDASASNATSVEFLLLGGSYGFSGHLIGTATSTLYGWLDSWNTTTVPNGSYTLLSEAIGAGGSAFSSGVNVTVHN
jgi:hypothetical protein